MALVLPGRVLRTLVLGATLALPALVAAQAADSAAARREAEQREREFTRARQQYETRMRALQARLQTQLDEQQRAMVMLERELSRASAAEPRVRDSVLRAAEPRFEHVAKRIAAVQSEIEAVTRRQIERDLAVDGGPPGFPAGSVEARELAAVLARDYARMAGEMTAMARALAAQQASMVVRAASDKPRGRMGVTLTGRQMPSLRDGRMYMQYIGPQVIEAVEPGGPADRAGVEAGDTLVALGKVKLEDAEVPIAELLVPGEKLAVKVRRKGAEKALTMIVGEQRGAQAGPFAVYVQAPCPPGADCATRVVRGRVTATAAAPPRPPAPAVASWSMSFDGSLAGAVLQPIDEDLEELLGTDDGAFVLRVAPGTPAADAGLRSGDVIVRCEGEAVSSPRDVRRVLQRVTEKGGRSLALVVTRKGASRSVALRW